MSTPLPCKSKHPSDLAPNTASPPQLRAGNILPRRYTIQITKEFRATFCNDPIAMPPSPVRIAFWEKFEGESEWQERQFDAQAANEKAYRDYRQRVAEVQAENQRINRLNYEQRLKYSMDLAAHQQAVAAHKRRYSRERREKLEERLRNRLARSIADQQHAIESLLTDIAIEARDEILHSKMYFRWRRNLFIFALLSLTLPILAFLPALEILALTVLLLEQHRKSIIDKKLRIWNDEYTRPQFWNYYEKPERRQHSHVYTPYHFCDVDRRLSGSKKYLRETYPLGTADELDKEPCRRFDWLTSLASWIPGFSVFAVRYCVRQFNSHVVAIDVEQEARSVVAERKRRFLKGYDENLKQEDVVAYLDRRHKTPKAPPEPIPFAAKPLPPPPANIVAVRPEPPAECYDDGRQGNYSHTLKGSRVYEADDNRILARNAIFADNAIRPYFTFGDLPIPFYDGQSPHIICAGSSGAGKTTKMRMFMSALLPLTRSQAERIAGQSPDMYQRRPSSSHEWSRSLTHQAVIYNAKNENIPYLAALGFDTNSDLIILDPADSRCFAWDVARDINDRDSVSQFASLLVPVAKGAQEKNRNGEFWEDQARDIIEAIIVSFRNMAFAERKEPSWNLRDLVNAVETPESLRRVLQYHDTPEAMTAQLLDLAEGQASSVFLSAASYIRKFKAAGQRWVEAEHRGRRISLKDWAKNGAHSVLVLPNTRSNEKVNEPLNRALLYALTDIVLSHEFSFTTDESGQEHVRKRYFFFDELGQAGKLTELERLMSEGRSFGAHVVLGIHQLSQLRETYGDNGSENILGQCSYLALLRPGDTTTAEWMSKRIGEHLCSYDKKSFTYGTTKGTSFTTIQTQTLGRTIGTQESTTDGESRGTSVTRSDPLAGTGPHSTIRAGNSTHTDSHSDTTQRTLGTSNQDSQNTTTGTNESHSASVHESHTDSKDLRKDPAVYLPELFSLPDPATTGMIGGYFITPSLPIWRADTPIHAFSPRLESPEALNTTPRVLKWENDELVSESTPWTEDDYKRLCMAPPNLKCSTTRKLPSRLREVANEGRHAGNGRLPADFNF